MPAAARHHITNKFLAQYLVDGARPKSGDVIIRDRVTEAVGNKGPRGMIGFGVRISPGAVSFFVQTKMGWGESVKRTLGTFPQMTAEQARIKGKKYLQMMADGQDPIIEKRTRQAKTRDALNNLRRTFGKVFEEYAENKKKNSSPLTVKDREKVKKKIEKSKLWHTPFNELDMHIVHAVLAPHFDASPATGWKIYRFCCAAYATEAAKLKMVGNPFSLWRSQNSPKLLDRREKILPTTEEKGQVWLKELVKLRDDKRFPISVTADYLLCVLLWGGRKTETQKIKPEDIDFENRVVVFRGGNTKNKKNHFFPLTPWIASVLKARIEKNGEREGNWVFPSRMEGKHIVDIRNVLEKLTEASGLNIGAHDLRRTFATELTSDSGANLFIVKIAMNHAATNQDVTVGYIAAKAKVDALRPAYELRERRLMQLAGLEVAQDNASDDWVKAVLAASQNPKLKQAMQAVLSLA